MLQKQHQLTPKQARQGIEEYRARLDLHRASDMVYHENPSRVAETIAGAVRQGGFREPDPLEATTRSHGSC